MPQESRSRRRSFGYRQLISCEDPRGVVESGAIRKPKTAPTQKLESDVRKQKNLNNVEGEGLLKKEMAIGGVEEAHTRTSLQILEVSREAQKLNRVISSWSAGHSRNNSRDVAQDLLKGALHLVESLAVLSRLQQSSNYLSESTNKHEKQKIERGWFDDDDDDLDIKKDILDGVGRKDVYSCYSSEDACNAPSASKKKKKKRSNLVAKLMGLEEASLRSLSYDPRKDMGEGEKILNQNRPAFDDDLPRAKKHEHDPQKTGWKRRPTMDEMIEAVKFRGLPTNSLLNAYDVDSDDRPPIVILRPSRFSCLELEQPIIRADVFDEMIRGMRIRTNPLAQTDECGPVNYNADFGKAVDGKLEAASSLGKSRPHKKQLVENNAEEAQKVSGSRREVGMKVDMLPSATALYGRRVTKNSGNSEKNWPDNIHKVVNKISLVADQRYRDASQIEITDYDDDDQSSSSETPLLFGNQRNRESAYGKGRQSSTIDLRSIEGGNVCPKDEKRVYSVCDHHTNDNQSPYCRVDSSLGISQNGATRHIEEQEKSFYTTSAPCIDKLKALLLSNWPFIKRVEELFDLKVSPETCLLQQTDHGVDLDDYSVRVLLDTANELMGIHSFRCLNPWTTYHKTRSITRYSSLEQLLDEVCDEIEALRCNSKDEGNDHSTDSLLLLVKGDWRSTGMVGGMWDMGWTSAGSENESEEITRGVGELVLDGLIEEILVDLTPNIKFSF